MVPRSKNDLLIFNFDRVTVTHFSTALASMSQTISEEAFMNFFESSKQSGQKTAEDKIQDYKLVEIDEQPTFVYFDNTIFTVTLDENLILTFEKEKKAFYFTRTLPNGTLINYHNKKTFFYGEGRRRVLSRNGQFYSFRNEDIGEEVKELEHFRNLKRSQKGRSTSKYTCESIFGDLIPVHLYKYTTNEIILNYFSGNNFILTTSPEHQQCFVDLPVEQI